MNYNYKLKLQFTIINYNYNNKLQITITNYNFRWRRHNLLTLNDRLMVGEAKL